MGLGNAIGIGIPMVSLGLGGGSEPVEERFIISVKTDNAGTSADNEFTLPWIGTYDVDWGDGNTETSVVDTQTHTYASAGTYDVKVTAVSGRIRFNNGGDKDKLLDIKNWGTCTWTDMSNAFYGCNSLTVVSASDTPNLSSIPSLYVAFSQCISLTSMYVSNWDVSNVTNMQFAFRNSPITTLDVSNWNTQSLIIASHIFQNAIFSPDVSNWNMSNVTTVREMLRNADLFDRSLANWDISNITTMTGLLVLAPGLSTTNYDATLISWAAQTPQNGISVNFGGSQYSLGGAAEAARNTLINTYSWTITDGGGV
jgi:surface protein